MAACIASVEAERLISPAQNGDPEWTPTHTMNRQAVKARCEITDKDRREFRLLPVVLILLVIVAVTLANIAKAIIEGPSA